VFFAAFAVNKSLNVFYRRLGDMINQQRVVEEFLELVRFPSTSGNERLLADVLISRLRDLGLVVIEDDVGLRLGWTTGNIIARWPATVPGKQTLMFCAHMDHVAPGENIEPFVQDGVIYSKGETILGADDKAGIVPIMEALRVIYERKIPHGGLEIVFTVAEENGLNGAKHIDSKMLTADLGYVLDTDGSAGKIVVQAPAQNRIKAVIYGKAAHAGIAPETGINAIQAASAAIAQIKMGRIDAETTANVGVIHGGKATNIIPEHVEVLCEARSLNTEKLHAQTKHMKEIFEQVVVQWGARVEVTVENQYLNYRLDEDNSVVQLALQAAQKIGVQPLLQATGGGSDANFFNTYGIPTTVLGVGMSNVHTTEEYVTIHDLVRTTEYVLAIIQTAAAEA
jgi:tripeptide aminopeptidase